MQTATSSRSSDDLSPPTPEPPEGEGVIASAANDTVAAGQAKAILDLQYLLEALTHPALAAKPWAGALPARISEALDLLEIVRLTVATSRPANEVITAANHLVKELRLADITVQRSRADQLTKATVRMALGLAQRILSGFKGHPPSSKGDKPSPAGPRGSEGD